MTQKVAAIFFLGQGGMFFSNSFAAIGLLARQYGVITTIYDYDDFKGETWLKDMAEKGYRIAAIGYSLGVTMATYLQTIMKLDLVISVAPSTLAENHLINKENTKRSVLFYGTDFLSSAGQHDNYDEKTRVIAGFGIPVISHLSIPSNPIVVNGILNELAKLQKGL